MSPEIPLLIVGAGRSGTNFLSQVFENDARFWNAYESRYIWNYGQRTLAHDVRRPEEATPKVRRFIRDYFPESRVVRKILSNIF